MKKLAVLLLAFALCFSLSACWEVEAEELQDFWELEPEPVEREPEPEPPAAFTLPYLNGQTFDPITCSDGVQQVIGSLLYEGLFALDSQFEAQPLLCASYTRSANGLTYTFTLRGDAAFSNGAALGAADVLATYRRAQASERYAARFANVASMRVNRGTLLITLKQADSAFPALLDIPIVKSGTEKDTVPLGTGPYLFLTDTEGPCLVRNGNWWNGTPSALMRIALVPAKDTDTAAYLFSAHRVHLLTADLLSETSASGLGGVDITDAPTGVMLFLGFNTHSVPLADSALRRAMGLALDRDFIASTLLTGHADAAQFPISPFSPLYPAALETPYETGAYAEALDGLLPGEPDGSTPELALLVNAENPFKVSLADYLARQLSTERLAVTPSVLPWSEYLAALESGAFDLWLGEVRLTADWNAASLVGTGGTLNYGGYANAATDAALKAFLVNENNTTAEAFYTRLAEEAPILPLAFKGVSLLTPDGLIDGMSPTAAQPFSGLERWTLHFSE